MRRWNVGKIQGVEKSMRQIAALPVSVRFSMTPPRRVILGGKIEAPDERWSDDLETDILGTAFRKKSARKWPPYCRRGWPVPLIS